ncbi:MAG: hypothetical protein GVY02_01100 [Bacteroidetes bacterium]|jgi:hypothetical protein|nr:hypothetical protein [Bacteroidota bacterium]
MVAISLDEEEQAWRIGFDRIGEAMDSLSAKILRFQGHGDYEGVDAFFEGYGVMGEELQASLIRLAGAGILSEIVFNKGIGVLGLD